MRPTASLALFLLTACASDSARDAPPASARLDTTAAETGASRADTAAFRVAIQRLEQEAAGRLGVGAALLEGGETFVNGDARHPMQSVYKLPIAMAVLRQVDRGILRLDQEVEITPADMVRESQHSPIRDAHPAGTRMPLREVLRFNTAESDGTACDVLLRLAGGPANVDAFLGEIGVRGLRVANTEKEIGSDRRVQYENWMTAAGGLALLRAVHGREVLSDSSRTLLLRHMVETPTGMRRLRGGLPEGTVVAHKTGSSGSREGVAAATNDIGIVTLPDGRHLALAVLLTDSRLDEAGRERVIAGVARAAWDAWTR